MLLLLLLLRDSCIYQGLGGGQQNCRSPSWHVLMSMPAVLYCDYFVGMPTAMGLTLTLTPATYFAAPMMNMDSWMPAATRALRSRYSII